MKSKLYIPSVKNQAAVVIAHDVFADKLFDLIQNSEYQQRARMIRHRLLDQAAAWKVKDMEEKGYFAHGSPAGVWPNDYVRSTGYILPSFYLKNKNNVESLSIGGNDPKQVADGWYKSPGHQLHVYALDKFYREQECVGIATGKAKDGRLLCVFVSAPCYDE